MEIVWDAGWYANRLHAREPNSKIALCGFRFPTRLPTTPWREKLLQKGPPKCKHCLRKIGETSMPYICTLIACDEEKKALRDEIERLKADVQNLCDENARLRADLQWLKEGRRPIQKEHFPPKDASRETER